MDHNSRHELNPKLLAGSSLKFETYQSGVTAYIRDFNPLTSVIARALRLSSLRWIQSVESRWWTSRAWNYIFSKHFCIRFCVKYTFLFLVGEKRNNFTRWTMMEMMDERIFLSILSKVLSWTIAIIRRNFTRRTMNKLENITATTPLPLTP